MKTKPRHVVLAIVFCSVLRLSAQSLPAGWTAKDIGAVGSPGSSNQSGGGFTITGDGADIWGSADAFQFAYIPLTSDGDIVARVRSVDPVNVWTKAGVMMRETLSAGSRHALMAVTPARGVVFQRRLSTNGTSTTTASNTVTAPAYVKLTRSGNTLTGYRSADGVSWTMVGTDVVSMASTIYVGLAVTSHSYGVAATAIFDSVTLGPRRRRPRRSRRWCSFATARSRRGDTVN
jgi:hypothetical protein